MRNLSLFLGAMLTLTSISAQVDTILPTNTLIEYTGRIDFSNPNAPEFSYSGVSIRANFNGSSISMVMNDDIGQNYFNIILDGKVLDRVHVTQGTKEYILAEGLEVTEHEIEIFKRTEVTFGKTSFLGFIVDQGTSLSVLKNQRTRFIEYIGNSITCGYGNEGELGESFGPTTENHYLTYAAITSRNFNARHMAVSRSGIGIYRNYDGPLEGNQDCMSNNYTRTFLYDEDPKFDFIEQPDVVCINLGTNDFSTTGADSALYVSNYFRLIDTIQSKYDSPNIICLVGSMLSGGTLSKVKGYVQFIADSANNKGKGNVHFFEMSAQTGDLGIAVDYHPTVAQHKRNATELTNYISTLMDWKIQPLLSQAQIDEVKHILLNFNVPLIDPENLFEGFTLKSNGLELAIDSISIDSEDEKVLHLRLQSALSVGELVNLNYQAGTIMSDDSISLGTINAEVQNNLTETVLSEAFTSNDGQEVYLVFNKKIDDSSEFSGVEFRVDGQTITIDSFLVNNQQIVLYPANSLSEGEVLTLSLEGQGIFGFDGVVLLPIQDFQVDNNIKATGVNESGITPVDIYPNPNKSGLISYTVPVSYLINGMATIEIIHVNGSTVYNGQLTDTSGLIDLSGKVSRGLYLIKVTSSNNVIHSSILIV